MRSKIRIILVFLVVSLVAGLVFIMSFGVRSSNALHFEIVDKNMDVRLEGTDKVAYVYVTVRNIGDSGNVTVYAKIIQTGIYSDVGVESKSIHLDSGESKSLTFKFSVHQIWPHTWSHKSNPVKPEGRVPNTYISYDIWVESES